MAVTVTVMTWPSCMFSPELAVTCNGMGVRGAVVVGSPEPWAAPDVVVVFACDPLVVVTDDDVFRGDVVSVVPVDPAWLLEEPPLTATTTTMATTTTATAAAMSRLRFRGFMGAPPRRPRLKGRPPVRPVCVRSGVDRDFLGLRRGGRRGGRPQATPSHPDPDEDDEGDGEDHENPGDGPHR